MIIYQCDLCGNQTEVPAVNVPHVKQTGKTLDVCARCTRELDSFRAKQKVKMENEYHDKLLSMGWKPMDVKAKKDDERGDE